MPSGAAGPGKSRCRVVNPTGVGRDSPYRTGGSSAFFQVDSPMQVVSRKRFTADEGSSQPVQSAQADEGLPGRWRRGLPVHRRSRFSCRKTDRFVRPVAKRPVSGPAAAAECDRPVPGGQAKLPVVVVGDPEPEAGELFAGRQFNDQRTVEAAADRQGVRRQPPPRGPTGPLRRAARSSRFTAHGLFPSLAPWSPAPWSPAPWAAWPVSALGADGSAG
jgi:hypothetical protein